MSGCVTWAGGWEHGSASWPARGAYHRMGNGPLDSIFEQVWADEAEAIVHDNKCQPGSCANEYNNLYCLRLCSRILLLTMASSARSVLPITV